MSDDLAQFFAQKEKKKAKKAKGINLDSVGSHLDSKAKKQEEQDREDEEQLQQQREDEKFIRQQVAEDSEWHDYKDESKGIDLEGVGIRRININDIEEQEEEEEVQKTAEPARTWNIPTAGQDENKAPVGDKPQKEDGGGKYIPAHRRQGAPAWGGAGGAAPDLKNVTEFPDIAAAEEMAKLQKDKEKEEAKRSREFTENQRLRDQGRARHGVVDDERQKAMSAVGAIVRTAQSPAADGQSPPPAKPNVYVPPSRRAGAMGALATPVERATPSPPAPSAERPPSAGDQQPPPSKPTTNAWVPPHKRK